MELLMIVTLIINEDSALITASATHESRTIEKVYQEGDLQKIISKIKLAWFEIHGVRSIRKVYQGIFKITLFINHIKDTFKYVLTDYMAVDILENSTEVVPLTNEEYFILPEGHHRKL